MRPSLSPVVPKVTTSLLRATLVILTLFVLMLTSSPVTAAQDHEMHNSASMSQEMMHEHIRDCAAACGVAERSESRKISVNQRKKQREIEPKNDAISPSEDTFHYNEHKYRDVFKEPKNDIYLRFAQLRL
jgi:hypothetical protein